MSTYLTEQEQVELLKNWIKQYSVAILVGVVLAMLIIFSWRYWQERQHKLETHASIIFDEMLTARVQHDADALQPAMDKLLTHYPRTVYASFAALMLARENLKHLNYAEAKKQLNWVLMYSNIPSLREITRLRLARVLIAEKDPKAGIAILDKVDDKHFDGLINEIKGDAYLTMNQPVLAREWYQKALDTLPNAEVIRPLLQMKYDNLA
ncbi:MAG: hypothetical protein A3F43_02415 [Gammaproteobacteria bacterium RIFCSPHIGHO2_12_FULL_42_10]|nr:MAG: hypothetical protein A3F43_02415 [Gammaproteobacteria bacterium RIFCSPHIGHO2_12_FULL_42_10]